MAHKVTAVLSPKPGQAAAVEVPQEIRDEIDGLYDHLREHTDQEGFVEFDSADEKAEWVKQVRAYCATREAGALKYRQLPSKTLPETQLRFKLTADLETNGQNASGKPAAK